MKKMLIVCMLTSTMLVVYSCGPSEMVVTSRPAAPVHVRPGPPGSVYVWRDGDWIARGGRYHWREGRWVKARHRAYIPGHWEPRGSGWYWRRGHWR